MVHGTTTTDACESMEEKKKKKMENVIRASLNELRVDVLLMPVVFD